MKNSFNRASQISNVQNGLLKNRKPQHSITPVFCLQPAMYWLFVPLSLCGLNYTN